MGVLTNWLKKKIKDKKNANGKIDKDIAALEQGIADANSANESYLDASTRIKELHSEIMITFQGKAIGEFEPKLLIYYSICESMAEEMTKLAKEYSRQIDSLKTQKKKRQDTIDQLENWCEKLKKIGL